MDIEHGSVLVVDDNEDNRVVLKRRLERRGLTVSCAEEGRRALDLLGEAHFDLVLLDIMMPVMNGYEVLEKMKADEHLRRIPTIVISGIDDMDSIVKCIELGAEDYLLKPFNSTLLWARINASLEKKFLRDQEEVHLKQIEEYNTKLEQRIAEHMDELKMARRVQASLLPAELPSVEGWDFAVRWYPAREIAGDYYDFIQYRNGTTAFVIGDVTDKGLPAALFMVFARNSVRSGIYGTHTPAETIARANRLICTESTHGLYITLVFALLKPDCSTITYVNAGHFPPLVYRAREKTLSAFEPGCMPLGVDIEDTYVQHEIDLKSGDCIVFYTDGVTDALNGAGEAFGLERFREVVLAHAGESAGALVSAVETSLKNFIGETAWFDDVTLAIVRKE